MSLQQLITLDGHVTNAMVTSDGKVYDWRNGRYLHQSANNGGYLSVSVKILDTGEFVICAVHRLVALAFVKNDDPETKTTVDHKDGNKTHNWAGNLEWTTQGENNRRAYALGLHKPLKAEQVTFTKYTREQVVQACELLQAGEAPLVVAKKTGIEVKNLYDIRKGRLWKDVTCNYTFPKSKYPRSSLYEPELREKVEEMIMQGIPPAQIRDQLNIPHLYKHIQDWKYQLMKAQRLEKGSE